MTAHNAIPVAADELAELRAQRDELLEALKGAVFVFAEQAETTRALTRTELEQLAFARAVIAGCRK